MNCTCLRLFAACSRQVLARRGHGGTAQAQRELTRLALLEQSMTQPAEMRARQTPSVTQAATAAYLRELPDRVELVRAAAARTSDEYVHSQSTSTSGCAGASASPATAAAVEEPRVSTLTQFLTTCKQLKIRFSSNGDAASRRRGREELRSFWARHASSAVACCYQGVREVGFVAEYGLTDTGMHLEASELWTMLRVLKAERAVASAVDATRILRYLARELQYLERPISVGSNREVPGEHPSGSGEHRDDDLVLFRHALTDLALDVLAFFFVLHSPAVDKSQPVSSTKGAQDGETALPTTSSSSASKLSIASATDALSGLEVLAVVNAQDAADDVLAHVWEQRHLWSLRRQREPAIVAAAQTATAWPPCAANVVSMQVLAREIHYLMVAELFRFIAVQRRDLRMTDVVHGFALLRVHLRTLWPPYARMGSGPKAQSGRSGGSRSPTSSGKEQPPGESALRLPLWYEKDTLFRTTWGLAVALVAKDRQLISSYHYVKIVTALAKLPAFVLAPEPLPRRVPHRFEFPKVGDDPRSSAAHAAGDEHPIPVGLLSVDSEIPPAQRHTGPAAPSGTPSASPAPATARQPEKDEMTTAMVAFRPADFWRFIVSKACVFVPSLPPEQQRVVCRSLHFAITEKRGHLLRDGSRQGPLAYHTMKPLRRGAPSGFGRAPPTATPPQEDLSDDAADIVLPLVEEMAGYAENYDACIRDPRKSPSRSYQRRSARHRPK